MAALLLVFVPVALLVVIAGFGFVGCVLNTKGTGADDPPKPVPFTKYSSDDVLGNGSCVGYWPLDEASPADDSVKLTAHDAKGSNDGEYKHKGNAPALFPCPAFEITPGIDSALAFGGLSLGVQSIVPGDAKQPGSDPDILTTGMQVDGAFVTVPPSGVVNPPGPFTFEAWARAEWAGDQPAFRTLVDSRNNAGTAHEGFAIWVNQDAKWQAVINCTGTTNVIVTAKTVSFSSPTHVVLRFDGANLTLFINAVGTAPEPLPAGQTFSPNTTEQMVFGNGNPWLPPRMQPTDTGLFPYFPFKGTIQNVAIYNAALSDADIKKHFDDGSGKTTVPAG